MTLEVMICTIDGRLQQVERMLLPKADDITYLVSCQYTTEAPPAVPDALSQRDDVRCIFLKGRGLSRNRNHAIHASRGDILLVADDDEELYPDGLQGILRFYQQHPHVDVAHCRIDGVKKAYPPTFVQSQEISFRRTAVQPDGQEVQTDGQEVQTDGQEVQHVGQPASRFRSVLRFDERFGLGSAYLAAGEEEVFIHDARQMELNVCYVPLTICRIEGPTTGSFFLSEPLVQRSKGATFCYMRGAAYAYYKCTREAFGWMLRRRVNPFPLLRNMYWGIRYIHLIDKKVEG